jgi:hypothetical protein
VFGAHQLLVKWFVVYTSYGTLFYLKEEDETGHKRVWTQRRDSAMKYPNQLLAEAKVVEIKELFHNKYMKIKVI